MSISVNDMMDIAHGEDSCVLKDDHGWEIPCCGLSARREEIEGSKHLLNELRIFSNERYHSRLTVRCLAFTFTCCSPME